MTTVGHERLIVRKRERTEAAVAVGIHREGNTLVVETVQRMMSFVSYFILISVVMWFVGLAAAWQFGGDHFPRENFVAVSLGGCVIGAFLIGMIRPMTALLYWISGVFAILKWIRKVAKAEKEG